MPQRIFRCSESELCNIPLHACDLILLNANEKYKHWTPEQKHIFGRLRKSKDIEIQITYRLEPGSIGTGKRYTFGGKGVPRGFIVIDTSVDLDDEALNKKMNMTMQYYLKRYSYKQKGDLKDELLELLRSKGLETSGNRKTLINRLFEFSPYDAIIYREIPKISFAKQTREQRAMIWSGQPDQRTVFSPGPIYPVQETFGAKTSGVLPSSPQFTFAPPPGQTKRKLMTRQQLEKKSDDEIRDILQSRGYIVKNDDEKHTLINTILTITPFESVPMENVVPPHLRIKKEKEQDDVAATVEGLIKSFGKQSLSQLKNPPAYTFGKMSREPPKDKDPGSPIGNWELMPDGTYAPKETPSPFGHVKGKARTFGPGSPHTDSLAPLRQDGTLVRKAKGKYHVNYIKRFEEARKKADEAAWKMANEKNNKKNPARFGIILWEGKSRKTKPNYSQYRLYG